MCIIAISKLNKPETPGALGIVVERQVNITDIAKLRKRLLQLLRGCSVVQVAYEYTVRLTACVGSATHSVVIMVGLVVISSAFLNTPLRSGSRSGNIALVMRASASTPAASFAAWHIKNAKDENYSGLLFL